MNLAVMTGSTLAAASAATWLTIADAPPSDLWGAGPWVILAASLTTAAGALWKELRDLRAAHAKEQTAREERERSERAIHEAELRATMDAQRETLEKLAESIARLKK